MGIESQKLPGNVVVNIDDIIKGVHDEIGKIPDVGLMLSKLEKVGINIINYRHNYYCITHKDCNRKDNIELITTTKALSKLIGRRGKLIESFSSKNGFKKVDLKPAAEYDTYIDDYVDFFVENKDKIIRIRDD